jgi:hypothetical protein
VVDSLRQAGWSMSPLRLFEGRLEMAGTKPDGRALRLWYQSKPAQLGSSLYKTIQTSHEIAAAKELRPDITLLWDATSHDRRWLLIECKLNEKGIIARAARRALLDLLAYRHAFGDELSKQSGRPYGLGLVWGEGLEPDPECEIMLASKDRLAVAITATVK